MRTLRIAGLVIGAALAFASPGGAADLGAGGGGYKDSAFEPPSYWRGLYVGATLGASGSSLSIRDSAHDNPHVGGGSFSGGLLMGYNFRSGPWVGGFEADISAMSVDETKNLAGYGDVNISSNWYGSLRLRGGYAWDRTLFYVTGGLGAGQWEMKAPLSEKQTVGLVSPTLGAGVEFALDNNWAVRIEALAAAGGTVEKNVNGVKEDVRFGMSTVRLGITRRF